MQRVLRWLRSHPWSGLLLVLLAAFVLLNVLAYRHAYAMMHFVPAGDKPVKPEALTAAQKVAVLLQGVQVPRPVSLIHPGSCGLDYEVHNFRGRLGELEAWLIPHPKPQGIVLMFHGYAACKTQVLPEAGAFHALGYSCFLVDFPGSGGSEGNVTTVGYREAEDVSLAVQYVRRRWLELSVVLFGRSMGSVAILRALAVEGTRADAAVVECPFDRMLSTVEARFAVMGVPSFPCARLLVFWGGMQEGFDGFSHNPADYASLVECPVLLLHGQKDRFISDSQTATIYRNLRGRKELHTFSELGHESYLQKQPDEWKECVKAFIGSGRS